MAIFSLESTALDGKRQQRDYTSQHSSSLTSLEQSTQQQVEHAILRSTNADRHGKGRLTRSNRYHSLMMRGNSPSARRSSHWMVNENEEDLMPIAPDEIDDLSRATHVNLTVQSNRRNAKRKIHQKLWYEEIEKNANIAIYISGGAADIKNDRIIYDNLSITSSDGVEIYFESELTGKAENKKQIDREELFELVQWIAESGYFELDGNYSCADGDENCLAKLESEPMPLKIEVVMASNRKVVTVPVFSPVKRDNIIEYPENLRKIVKAIYEFASL